HELEPAPAHGPEMVVVVVVIVIVGVVVRMNVAGAPVGRRRMTAGRLPPRAPHPRRTAPELRRAAVEFPPDRRPIGRSEHTTERSARRHGSTCPDGANGASSGITQCISSSVSKDRGASLYSAPEGVRAASTIGSPAGIGA